MASLADASPQHWQILHGRYNCTEAAITLLADASSQQWQILHKRLDGVEAAITLLADAILR
eukprot:9180484-Prorocentrum_lima.AAC.1